MIRWLTGMALASAALAQTGDVQGPVLGLLFDQQAAAARPLLGIPGSASVGAPLPLTAGLRGVTAPPGGAYAIGIDGANAVVLLTSSGQQTLPITGATRVCLSSRGITAAVYRAEAGAVDVVTGLPNAPRVDRTVAIEFEPAALAVSNDAAALVALSRATRGVDAVVWIGRDGAPLTLEQTGRIEGLSFLDDSTALIAEPQAVKLVSPAIGSQTVADGVQGVLAAAASADGSKIAIALRSGSVAVQDRASGERTTLSCGCAPAELVPVRGNAVFRLNEIGDGPLWLLDGDAPSPRITFVAVPAGGAQ